VPPAQPAFDLGAGGVARGDPMIDADGTIGFADDEPVEDEVGTPADSLNLSVRTPHRV
jgi:hypothetical protein